MMIGGMTELDRFPVWVPEKCLASQALVSCWLQASAALGEYDCSLLHLKLVYLLLHLETNCQLCNLSVNHCKGQLSRRLC